MLLDTFSHTGVLAPALQAAGICRATHYLWLDQDPDYAQAFREATAEARDTLESEVFRRAVEGTTETHWTKDGGSYEITKYSDNLLMFLTKQRDPSFRDGPRTVVQAGAGFDANGQPYAGIQVSESIEALAENFARWQERHAIDVTSTES